MIRFDVKEIASVFTCDLSTVKRRAKREAWSYTEETVRGGKRRLYASDDLPAEVRKALAVQYPDRFKSENPVPAKDVKPKASKADDFTYDRDAIWSNYERKNGTQKSKAEAKLSILEDAANMADAGLTMTDALQAAAERAGKSYHTVKNWYFGAGKKRGVRSYARADWLPALVNQYVGNTDSKWSPEAWEFFKGVYLRPEQPTIAACHQWTAEAAKEHDWSMPGKTGCERAARKYISTEVRVLMREGEAALGRLFPSQQRTVRDLHAMQWISGDGYTHNVFVKFRDGSIGRPKTWFWQDVRSRKFVGWRTDVSENSCMIRLAFGDAVDRYGIPEDITIDNTRAAANKWLTGGVPNRYRFKVREEEPLGVFPAMGCRIHWTTIVHGEGRGQAKPVERAFGIGGLGDKIDKRPEFSGAYTGPNPMAKPENYGESAIPIEEFEAVLEKGIRAFNAMPKRRTEVCAGQMSFDEAFAESYNASRHLIRQPTQAQRRLWLMPAEGVRVQADSSIALQIGRGPEGLNRYTSDALISHIGHKVIVRFDPDDLHAPVHCYTDQQVYIGQAEIAEAAGFGDAQAGRRWRREITRRTKAAKDMAEAERGISAAEAARWMESSDSESGDDLPGDDSNVVRGAFEKPKRAVGSDIEPDAEDTGASRFNFDDFMERQAARWKEDHI